jgi:dipeptidyl aminopeptidase/acylaminoacyl peptidase
MFRFSLSGTKSVFLTVFLVCAAVSVGVVADAGGLTFEQLAALRTARGAVISPDGSMIAYTLSVPRRPGVDTDGGNWSELHVVSVEEGVDRTFIGGEVSVSGVQFSPDGKLITYLAKRDGDDHKNLWAIPVSGGESRRMVVFDSAIEDYELSPDGSKVAFVAKQPESEERKEFTEKGYSQEVFEEDWLPRKVWVGTMPTFEPEVVDPLSEDIDDQDPTALEIDGSVFHVGWSPDGTRLLVDVAPRPLIDDRYMLRKVTVVDAATGQVRVVFDNPGKLGDFQFSPDGNAVAMNSAADPNDPSTGRLLVAPAIGGELRDVLPGLEGHISDFAWQDGGTLLFISGEGVETRLGEVDISSLEQTTHAVSGPAEGGGRVPIMSSISLSKDGQTAALIGNSPSHPSEVFVMHDESAKPTRLTDGNPWLADVEFAEQGVFRHAARDGLELEGVLLRPTGDGARRTRGPPQQRLADTLRFAGAAGGDAGLRRLRPQLSGQHRPWSRLFEAQSGGCRGGRVR